jgi:hypothetical protein
MRRITLHFLVLCFNPLTCYHSEWTQDRTTKMVGAGIIGLSLMGVSVAIYRASTRQKDTRREYLKQNSDYDSIVCFIAEHKEKIQQTPPMFFTFLKQSNIPPTFLNSNGESLFKLFSDHEMNDRIAHSILAHRQKHGTDRCIVCQKSVQIVSDPQAIAVTHCCAHLICRACFFKKDFFCHHCKKSCTIQYITPAKGTTKKTSGANLLCIIL